MKKTLMILLLTALTFWASTLAGDHFRYDLYHLAIDYERDKAGLSSHSAQINDQNYYYLQRLTPSAKDTVILLHGFSADKSNWLRFVQALPADYNVIALDLLGHGEHPVDLNRDYHIERQVDYVHDFIVHFFNKPVHLVGNSMGGAIASLYAANFPDQVASLMLISPAGIHDIPSEMEHLLEQDINPLIAGSIDDFYQVVDFVMEDAPFIPHALLKVQAEKAVARYPLYQKIFADIRQDLDKNLDARFSDIHAPTMILWGKQDRVIHADNIKRYAELVPKASSRILDGIGHLAMLEAPVISARTFIEHSSATHKTTQ